MSTSRSKRKSVTAYRQRQKVSTRRGTVSTAEASDRSRVSKKKHPRWEFLTRTIAPEDLAFIKGLGGLYPSLKRDARNRVPAVYTQYLSSELIPEQLYTHWNYVGEDPCSRITLIIHPDALKDFDFTVCSAPIFGVCMKPEIPDSLTIMSSKKRTKTRPDMSKLVNYINDLLKFDSEEDKEFFNEVIKIANPDATITAEDMKYKLYMLTHEILFTSIPNVKYISAVFTCDEYAVPAIKSYLPKTPVFVIDPPKSDTEFYYRDCIAPILKDLYDELH
jgi:hypothetical protein